MTDPISTRIPTPIPESPTVEDKDKKKPFLNLFEIKVDPEKEEKESPSLSPAMEAVKYKVSKDDFDAVMTLERQRSFYPPITPPDKDREKGSIHHLRSHEKVSENLKLKDRTLTIIKPKD